MNIKNFISIIKQILRIKLIFQTPKNFEIVVFDDVGAKDLKNVLSGYNYFILEVRTSNLKNIYISPKVIKTFFLNFKGRFKDAYIVSILKIINPKLVLTFIDNSYKFFDIAKLMKNSYEFIAIQNGARYDFKIFKHKLKRKINKTDFSQRFYIPNFFCFGQFEVDDYKKNKIDVGKFYKVGSINLANFLLYKKKNNLNLKEKFDVCLISDACLIGYSKNNGLENCEQGFADMTKFTIKFCLERKLKFVFALARLGELLKGELDFYKQKLTENEFNFLVEHSVKRDDDKYSSYKAMLESNIVVSNYTTMLREKLAMGGKILSCNLTPSDMYDFPVEGLCFIKDCSYEDFKERMLEIKSLTNDEYFSKLKKDKNYLMRYEDDNSSINIVRKNIDIFLRKKQINLIN